MLVWELGEPLGPRGDLTLPDAVLGSETKSHCCANAGSGVTLVVRHHVVLQNTPEMNRNRKLCACLLGVLSSVVSEHLAYGWSEHTLLTWPVFDGFPEVAAAEGCRVESIESFLSAESDGLRKLLANEEEWARKNLQFYRPRPDALEFKGNAGTLSIREQFCRAIRVNPAATLALYLQLLPGQDVGQRTVVPVDKLTFLNDKSSWKSVRMVELVPGELVSPLAVLATASDEPDLGLDVGLFTNNGTACGSIYGFGRQPFGNPHLDYGSQAPFHMGFYHEKKIAYFFAGFLKETYPEYRIHLYKTLSEFAFRTGHSYWGWRFAGWGLHYLGDLCQPYHSTAIPRVSTLRAVWVNTLSLIGFGKAKANLVQLVSNRHLALEKFLQLELHRMYLTGETNTALFAALRGCQETPLYDDNTPRCRVAKFSNAMAVITDKTVAECMPAGYVSDPSFEFGTCSEQDQLVDKIRFQKGPEAIGRLTSICKDLLALYCSAARGYIKAILSNSTPNRN